MSSSFETTSGKAFSGGRSTPVYKVSGTVRKENGTSARRQFVVKWYAQNRNYRTVIHGDYKAAANATAIDFQYTGGGVDMTRHWLCQGWIASTKGEAKLVCALEKALDEMDGGSMLLKGDNEYQAALHRFVFGP
ncbi:hypothetical protein FisN_3Lh348 [Fistulifera solaris]|uniref:Uncharacterized protein n=1 Tax=Fistulifera solaris TaxID=1519565 RepID=A0A1Z5J8C1_FISSO|nr:hypothetical protein FisN_3Lh348 [Fistulifera solaris]|eukprot:GAX10152.1 hypothetical protein FisN_3Lh348 [Fistulifera solaris]